VEATRTIVGLPGAEPYVANPAESPCVTDSAGAGTAGSGAAGSSAPGAAYTVSDASVPAATALTSVNGGTSNGTGNSVVLSSPAQAQASFVCVNGSAVLSGSSNVTGAVINGQTVSPASPGAETTTQMGGGSYTTINQQIQTATSLTERAVFTHIAGVGDYVLGEAQVMRPAVDPCPGSGGSGSGSGGTGSTGGGSGGSGGSAGSGGSGGSDGPGGSGGSGGDGALSACPTGSVLVASAQMCEIVLADGNIVVSKPFAGPTGGTVVPLAAARKKSKSSCLSGKGPKFAVMGTNKANTIRAAKTAERILAMGGNDKVIVKSGASCVDGGAGRDTISGGIGKVRLFGGIGNDRLSARNGSSYISGGNGADRITVGNGRDRVFGGAGKDTITVGTGKDHLFGGAGNDRLRAAGRIEYVNGGKGKDVAFVTAKEMRYARRHGCEKVHRIPAKH
jgi:Ca2+-binding RTX toxin-like protein